MTQPDQTTPSYMPNDSFVPFSNGTEHMMWLDKNCCRGSKGCRNYKPDATSSRHGCPIEVAFAIAACTGEIKAKMGLRAGFLEPGPNGTLVDNRLTDKGLVIPECPEYRGYDDPDDRPPRRGPKPPEGQIDLLDPRNQPVPSREGQPA